MTQHGPNFSGSGRYHILYVPAEADINYAKPGQ